jgi:hypothetical protein
MPTLSPPPAVEVQIADAIVAGINSYTFTSPYAQVTAVRRDVPDYEGQELKTLQVSVVCPSEEMEQARGGDVFAYTTTIVIAKHVTSQTDIDNLRRLRQEMVDGIRSNLMQINGLPEGTYFVRSYTQTAFDRDALSDRRVMLASIAVEHRLFRSRLEPLAIPSGGTGPTGA